MFVCVRGEDVMGVCVRGEDVRECVWVCEGGERM